MAVGRREDSSVLPGGGENAETVRLPTDGTFRGVQQNLRELSLSCDSKEHSQEWVAPRFCDLIMGALSQRAGRLAPAFLHTGFESGLLASLPISEHSVGTAEHAESSSVQIITCRVDCCLMNNPPGLHLNPCSHPRCRIAPPCTQLQLPVFSSVLNFQQVQFFLFPHLFFDVFHLFLLPLSWLVIFVILSTIDNSEVDFC